MAILYGSDRSAGGGGPLVGSPTYAVKQLYNFGIKFTSRAESSYAELKAYLQN